MSQCVAWLKRLEAGTFNWPKPSAERVTTKKMRPKAEALEMLLGGIDLKGTKMRPWYEEPSASA
jgi:transposase